MHLILKWLTTQASHPISWASVPFCPRQIGISMGRTRLIPGDDDDNFDDAEWEFTEDEECALFDAHGALLWYNHHTWAVSIINIRWESPWIQALPPIWCAKDSLQALISPSYPHLSFHARLMVIHPLMWSVKSIVPFIAATATSALVLWSWRNWMSIPSQAIFFWMSMTLRHVPQKSKWLWEVKTLSAMIPLQHAMCLSGGPYCSERHQNKQWLCLGISLNWHTAWWVACRRHMGSGTTSGQPDQCPVWPIYC